MPRGSDSPNFFEKSSEGNKTALWNYFFVNTINELLNMPIINNSCNLNKQLKRLNNYVKTVNTITYCRFPFLPKLSYEL